MSFLMKKISNKKKLFQKNINRKLTQVFTKLKTENSFQLFNSIMKSYYKNFYQPEKLAYSTRTIEKNNAFQKNQIFEKKTGNLSFRSLTNNKFIFSKKFSYYNKNPISKIINNKLNNKKTNLIVRKRKKNISNIINLLNKSSDICNNKKKETLKSSKTFILGGFNNQNTKNENIVKEESKIMLKKKQNNSEEKKGKEIIVSGNIFKYSRKIMNSYLTKNSNNLNNNISRKIRNKKSFLTKINKNKINKIVCNKKNIKDIYISLSNKNSSKDKNNCNLTNYFGNPNYSTNTIFKNKRNIYDNKVPLNITERENNETKINNHNTFYKFQIKTDKKINCLTNKNSLVNKNKGYYKINKIYNTRKLIINLNKNSNNNLSKNSRATENKNLKNINNKNKIIFKNIKLGNNNNRENIKNKIISIEKKDNSFDMAKTYTKLNNIPEKTDNEIKINYIKINEYNVKKPKEENMKFKLFINRNEEEAEEINKSKEKMGYIKSYKDLYDVDKLNITFEQKNNSLNLLSLNYKEKDKENNNIEELKINNNTNTYQFPSNNIEIKSILNYDEIDNSIDDLSISLLDRNNKYKNIILLPYREKKFSYINKYNTKSKSNLLKGNINKVNSQIMSDNKISVLKKYSKKKNINKIKPGKNSKKVK